MKRFHKVNDEERENQRSCDESCMTESIKYFIKGSQKEKIMREKRKRKRIVRENIVPLKGN